MGTMRVVYLFPEAAQTLAPVLPELSSTLLAPAHFWQLAYRLEEGEESGLGLWLPRPHKVAFEGGSREVQGRVLIPWRFIATMFEFTLDAEAPAHHVIGFRAPTAVHIEARKAGD